VQGVKVGWHGPPFGLHPVGGAAEAGEMKKDDTITGAM